MTGSELQIAIAQGGITDQFHTPGLHVINDLVSVKHYGIASGFLRQNGLAPPRRNRKQQEQNEPHGLYFIANIHVFEIYSGFCGVQT